MRKRISKNWYILIILLIILIPTVSIISLSVIVIPSRFGKIDYTWIAVKASKNDFVDIHTNDGTGRFYVSKGGYQLAEFTNEGLIGVDNETGTLYYRASALFRFGINYYTMIGITDAFPNMDLGAREEIAYVNIDKFTHDWSGTRYGLELIEACINYRTIDFDKNVANVRYEPFKNVNFKAHDYEGHIPITVTMHEDFGTIDKLVVGPNNTLYNPKIFAEIKKVIVDVVRSDVVGDYNDIYEGEREEFGSVSVYDAGTSLPSLGEGARKAEVTQTIQDLNLGCKIENKKEKLTVPCGVTGQSFIHAESVGVIWDNMESTPSFKFNLPVRIKPEITYCSEDVIVRWAKIDWDYEEWLFSPAYVRAVMGPIENVYPRYPSVHTTNRFVHQEFNVEMNFIAEMQFDPELGGVILADPFIIAGDFVWDESLFGESAWEIPLYTPLQDFFDFIFTSILPIILMIIVIAVVVFIFLKIGVPIIKLYTVKKKIELHTKKK